MKSIEEVIDRLVAANGNRDKIAMIYKDSLNERVGAMHARAQKAESISIKMQRLVETLTEYIEG